MDTPDINYKPKADPNVASLPEHLKNPANFEDIEKKVIQSIMSSCTHSDVFEMAECEKCTKKMLERRKLLKRLGFKNPAQYYAWKKIHTEIKKRYPLVDWAKNKLITP